MRPVFPGILMIIMINIHSNPLVGLADPLNNVVLTDKKNEKREGKGKRELYPKIVQITIL